MLLNAGSAWAGYYGSFCLLVIDILELMWVCGWEQ